MAVNKRMPHVSASRIPILQRRACPLPHDHLIGHLLLIPRRRQQIDQETQDPKGEDQRNDPLEYRRDILLLRERRGRKDDG